MWKHCVYIHREADTGAVFYVGKGYAEKRPYALDNRSRWWRNKVAKHGLVVEIVAHFADDAAAQTFERELIAFYGRADKHEGSLVNLTDGGEGSVGIIPSQELRAKRSAAASGPRSDKWIASIRRARKNGGNGGVVKHGDKLSAEWRAAISRGVTGARNHMFGKASPRRLAVVNAETGETYASVTAAANALGMRMQTLHNQLTGHRPNRTPLRLAR